MDNLYVPSQLVSATTIKMDVVRGDILDYSENVEHTPQYKEAFLRYDKKLGNLVDLLQSATTNNKNTPIATILRKERQIAVHTTANTADNTATFSLPSAMTLEIQRGGNLQVLAAATATGCCCSGGSGGTGTTFNIELQNKGKSERIAEFFESAKTGSLQMEFFAFSSSSSSSAEAKQSAAVLKLLAVLLMIAYNGTI